MNQIQTNPQMLKNNYIIGILGKKGSGKSELVKGSLPFINRYIVVDALHEYDGIIIYELEDLIAFIRGYNQTNYKVVYRAKNKFDTEDFLRLSTAMNDFTMVLEETDFYCNPHKINEYLEHNIKYGRHYNRNLIWVSRRPAEINRLLSSQSDLLISFKQTEPIDLKYFSYYTFNKDLKNLNEFEYAFCGNPEYLKIFQNFSEKKS